MDFTDKRVLVTGAIEAFGGLDILVNNAGVSVGDVLDQDGIYWTRIE